MAAMRVVQPKMKAIQDRFKDDKPRMQQEMLKLYQEEKVNPVAGCLPILLQIPIFYALYKVLMLAVEDRKSTRLNSSHANISYAVFCLKKKKEHITRFLTPS